MKTIHSVYGSIGLDTINKRVKNQDYEFWFVDRIARVLRFQIVDDADENVMFCRHKTYHIIAWDEIREKVLWTQYYKAGQFFDKMYESGHFFANKNHAIKYMKKRVETGRKDIIHSAKEYIKKYPECLV